jgi:hypothetical protein
VSVRISNVPVEIRTEHLPNESPQHYRCANPRCEGAPKFNGNKTIREVRPTQTHGRTEATETDTCQGFIHTCQDKHSYLHCVFTSLKGKRFQDVEGIKKNVTADLNAVPLEAFPDYFKRIVNKI